MLRSAKKRKRNDAEIEKMKGETVPAAHPPKLQPFTPSGREKGVPLAKLSNIWPAVKFFSTSS